MIKAANPRNQQPGRFVPHPSDILPAFTYTVRLTNDPSDPGFKHFIATPGDRRKIAQILAMGYAVTVALIGPRRDGNVFQPDHVMRRMQVVRQRNAGGRREQHISRKNGGIGRLLASLTTNDPHMPEYLQQRLARTIVKSERRITYAVLYFDDSTGNPPSIDLFASKRDAHNDREPVFMLHFNAALGQYSQAYIEASCDAISAAERRMGA